MRMHKQLLIILEKYSFKLPEVILFSFYGWLEKRLVNKS